MPMTLSDGQALNREKMCYDFVEKIVESVPASPPQSPDDCWFYPGLASNTIGYPIKKIARAGEANKWGVHRILFFMKNPALLPQARGALEVTSFR
ncbi:hypothetical protein CTA2_9477 [Colletotrichum tanaceti]|uniref:Uncharacterized protein n=1 Tax=Colletotrichum tanaceti TaxID=1306861 RepID=A0A4U6XC95_9PEZI|nr:hypothetical protein CTA2_9477 [Colletotrichum tanaceti]TKW53014.1 hypothetical protein CTA1_12695 [Colletotrichum tanaceti]